MKRLLFPLLLAGCASQAADTKPTPPPETQPAADPSAKKAPDFTLVDSENQPVALHDLLKKGPVILAFFPKAFTGG